MKRVFLSLVMFLLFVPFAQAYVINFDPSGSSSFDGYDLWNLDGQSLSQAPNGDFFDVITIQSLTTGVFTENFSLDISSGEIPFQPGTVDFTPYDLTADIYLHGTYFADDQVVFDDGTVTMKAAGTEIASLVFNSALSQYVGGSLIGGTLSLDIDVEFLFASADPTYFDDQDLIGKSWLLSMVGGRIYQQGYWAPRIGVLNPAGDTNPYWEVLAEGNAVIAWDSSSLVAEFAAVPEPSTIILLGAGLLGLVGLNRKKFFKK